MRDKPTLRRRVTSYGVRIMDASKNIVERLTLHDHQGPRDTRPPFDGFTPRQREADVQTLAHGDLVDFKTLDQPERIKPTRRNVRLDPGGGNHAFPPYSFTLLTFK